MNISELEPADLKRFEQKIAKTDNCWIWAGAKDRYGYGAFRLNGKTCRAHRVAYRAYRGEEPAGHVDHLCHRRDCVNPSHLRAVTNKQNQENRTGAQKRNVTGVRGVTVSSPGRYCARVTHNRKQYKAGYFSTVAEAEAAVKAKRLELFTHNDLDREAKVRA